MGLFCLNPGRDGGRSLVANALSIHNTMVREAPELAAELYQPLPYDYRGEEREGGKPWYLMPASQRHRDRDGHHTVAMQLQPGDMQFVNNYHVLHGREAYSDAPDEGQVRHLKGLWLETRVLSDDDKPETFRLDRSAHHWWSGRKKDDFATKL